MKKLLCTLFFSVFFYPAFPCLILFITDGKRILVGNHVDWYARDAKESFLPAQLRKYGMVSSTLKAKDLPREA
jgi:hypothetical protein